MLTFIKSCHLPERQNSLSSPCRLVGFFGTGTIGAIPVSQWGKDVLLTWNWIPRPLYIDLDNNIIS